jgi:hypothetical protein
MRAPSTLTQPSRLPLMVVSLRSTTKTRILLSTRSPSIPPLPWLRCARPKTLSLAPPSPSPARASRPPTCPLLATSSPSPTTKPTTAITPRTTPHGSTSTTRTAPSLCRHTWSATSSLARSRWSTRRPFRATARYQRSP